ncbi:MAG: hypothetical protein AAF802_14850 [Planctomycetota bacterium]
MHTDTPLALFLTWTCYGTFLPGDERGWFKRGIGWQNAMLPLEQWHTHRLQHDVVCLGERERSVCSAALKHLGKRRGWTIHAFAPRSNHCHLVVSSKTHAPTLIREQTKAELTKQLRKHLRFCCNQPIWTTGGWTVFLDTDDQIEAAVTYTLDAQDRKQSDTLYP